MAGQLGGEEWYGDVARLDRREEPRDVVETLWGEDRDPVPRDATD